MSQVSSLNDGQREAVFARGKNILVSAPAGSGKTKILVSRILELLKEGADVDQLLVLTFTQAAAGEMKQRLSSMLEEEIAKGHSALISQKEKLPFAYITNFHGFCNQLIGRYGFLLGIYPGYEILSDNQAMMNEAMEETLARVYEDPSNYEFIRTYFPNKNDLVACVFKLYEILQASGNKEAFLHNYSDEIYGFLLDHEDFKAWSYYPLLMEELRKEIDLAYVKLEETKAYCEENGIVYFYERPMAQKGKSAEKPIPYEAIKDYLDSLKDSLGKEHMNERFRNKPLTPYNIPWKDLDEEIKERCSKTLTSLKGGILKGVKDTYEALIDPSKDNLKQVLKTSKDAIDTLLDMTFSFEDHYLQKKQAIHVLDFNDLERYATKLLSPAYGVATDLNQKLVEIMVDEYQDSNQVQENIIQLIAQAHTPHVPCFMVGDMKQSIYRFRQADPEIFKEKYDHYPMLDNATRIDLGYNYRSRKVVLDSINFICNQVMDTDVGSLEYYHDPSAQLNYDFLRKEGCKDTSEYEDAKQKALARMAQTTDDYTEILMVDADSEEDQEGMDQREYEAYLVAKRILEGKWPLKDVAVLMRQTTAFITYKKVFDKLHIPTTIVLSAGFIQATEINRMLSVYKALANPKDDLSMMAFLRSPFDFSYFSDETIAQVEREEGQSLFDAIKQDSTFSTFIEVYESLREDLTRLPFKQWNELFFEKSGYLSRSYQMKNGMQRYQNLWLLLQKIEEKQGDIHHIQQWVTYFEHLGGAADSPAVVPKDQDAVTFMTIHKSKGLEFPIVFVSMHDKSFNLQDSKQRLIFDRHLSLGMKPRCVKDLPVTIRGQEAHFKDVVVEYDNVFVNLLARLQNRDTISEEMRIYYVALTRASKKLILTGTLSHEELKDYAKDVYIHQKAFQGAYIYNYRIRKAHNYMDWLIPSILRHQDILACLKGENEYIEAIALTLKTPLEMHLENTAQSRFSFRWLTHKELLDVPQTNDTTDKQKAIVYHVPTQLNQDLVKSRGVTATEEDDLALRSYLNPEVSVHSTLQATDKGTLVHAVFELLPLDTVTDVSLFIDQLYAKGAYREDEYAFLKDYAPKIQSFYKSPLYELCRQAKAIHKEVPLMYLEEQQVVHGIIDLLIEGEKEMVVVDYKTDQISSKATQEALIQAHKHQLQAYTTAIQALYPQKEISSYVYYLHINAVVKVF